MIHEKWPLVHWLFWRESCPVHNIYCLPFFHAFLSCHRIGQTRDVHIYRLISELTVEENILRKANQKRFLSDVAIEGGRFTTAFFKQNTINELFAEPSGLQVSLSGEAIRCFIMWLWLHSNEKAQFVHDSDKKYSVQGLWLGMTGEWTLTTSFVSFWASSMLNR